MELHFTHHAQYRLHTRNFSIERMKETIRSPDFTELSKDGKIVSIKRFDEGTLRVIYRINKRVRIIISVYYL